MTYSSTHTHTYINHYYTYIIYKCVSIHLSIYLYNSTFALFQDCCCQCFFFTMLPLVLSRFIRNVRNICFFFVWFVYLVSRWTKSENSKCHIYYDDSINIIYNNDMYVCGGTERTAHCDYLA